MNGLVAFLRACLDEDEQTARAATPGPWVSGSGNDHLVETVVYGQAVWPSGNLTHACDTEYSGRRIPNAAHIARHDPARVVADVDAKRRVIDLHSPVTLRGGAGAKYFDTTTVCRSCEPPQFPEHAFPCPTLRLLALPYREHPDYQPEWAPDV